MVLGEFGGLGLPIRGHTWQDEKKWGYRGVFRGTDRSAHGLIKNPQPNS